MSTAKEIYADKHGDDEIALALEDLMREALNCPSDDVHMDIKRQTILERLNPSEN